MLLLSGARRRREAVPGGKSRCTDAARAPSRREARAHRRAQRAVRRFPPKLPRGSLPEAESAASAAPSAFLLAPSLLRRPGGAVRVRSPRPRPAAVGARLAPPPRAAAGAAPSGREPRGRAPLESPAVRGGRGCRGCGERCVPCPPRTALAAAAPLSAMFPAPLSRRSGIPSSAGRARGNPKQQPGAGCPHPAACSCYGSPLAFRFNFYGVLPVVSASQGRGCATVCCIHCVSITVNTAVNSVNLKSFHLSATHFAMKPISAHSFSHRSSLLILPMHANGRTRTHIWIHTEIPRA